MKRSLFLTIAVAMLSIVVLQGTPALAQRVFVAAQGLDTNPCTFGAPCRTFQHAHDIVAAGGEIDVLDPAGYGMLTITKAISIQGHGFAGIGVASSGTGITINGSTTDTVSLNGLLIEGSGAGITGILFNSGKSLVVENCIVHHVTQSGLQLLGFGVTTLQTLSVSDSYFTDNGNNGIVINPSSSGGVTAAITRVGLYGNGFAGLGVSGAGATGGLNVAATDSVAANNGGPGFDVDTAASLLLTRATAAGNGTGVQSVHTNATLRLAQSTVSGNTIGYAAAIGGIILSYGDNYVDANESNSGTLGSATKQ